MATNPMQRKARNSFILGMLVMLVICGVIIAFLFIQITNLNKKNKKINKQVLKFMFYHKMLVLDK